MSDAIKHECGLGLIRLFHPLEYYQEKYGTPLWGLNKLYLLMEKQRNRGQDGAGIGSVKIASEPGHPYISRLRDSSSGSPWTSLFARINKQMAKLREEYGDGIMHDPVALRRHFNFAGEVLIGHLRYGTHGANEEENCHPVSRVSNWRNRSLLVAGNFNMTNVNELFDFLVDLGQHPRHHTDTETVLERIAYYLDVENEVLLRRFEAEGYKKDEIQKFIAEQLSIHNVLQNAARRWDGGYAMAGIVGNGDAFVARDPNGIRPAYYYYNEDFLVAASERSAICTVFNLFPEEIQELQPGHVLHVKGKTGIVREEPFTDPKERRSCSFERIYFSRGNDVKIYQERKRLGEYLVPRVLKAVNDDIEHTVFSYIPNTAESAYYGLVTGLENHLSNWKIAEIQKLGSDISAEALQRIMYVRPRAEKAIVKDAKMRTFITGDDARDEMVASVYDVTPGILEPGVDSLVCVDDSIVRGTTLRKSIMHNLARLKPRKIVIASSAPQIRYPDCYGIDMAKIGSLVAFEAAIALLKERGMEAVIKEVYDSIIEMKKSDTMEAENVVKRIYAPFTEDEITAKITALVTPENFPYEMEVVYQSIDNLHRAIPNHSGDWYFSGDYPTPGGNRVVNQAFLNYYEGKNVRAYQA